MCLPRADTICTYQSIILHSVSCKVRAVAIEWNRRGIVGQTESAVAAALLVEKRMQIEEDVTKFWKSEGGKSTVKGLERY